MASEKVIEVAIYTHPDDPSKIMAETLCCEKVFSAEGASEEEALAALKEVLSPHLGDNFTLKVVHRIH